MRKESHYIRASAKRREAAASRSDLFYFALILDIDMDFSVLCSSFVYMNVRGMAWINWKMYL